MNVVAIILAREGSKGVPKKNIIDFCGKPLIAWTIDACIKGGVDSVWVSSDSDEILEIASEYGTSKIKRPVEIAGDSATSESAWLHAINYIESVKVEKMDWILAPQVTSPLREARDISKAISLAKENRYDSFFSCSVAEDFFLWQKDVNGTLDSINYDWRNRKRRQDIPSQYIENGSFYMFKPEVLKEFHNRFGKDIGIIEMEFWKMFEIDSFEDLRMCSALMREFVIKK